VLSTDEFAAFGKGVVLFLHVTTRIPDEKDDTLLVQKGGTGFPYLAWLDADGDVMLVHEGDRSTKGFQKGLAELPEAPMRKLKAKATSDASTADYLLAQLEEGQMGYAEAGERVAKLAKVPPDKKKQLDDLITTREVFERPYGARTDAQLIATANRFLEMVKEKRIPTDEKLRMQLFSIAFKGLEKAKDAKGYESALAEAKRALANDSKSRKLIENAERTLADLKKSAPKNGKS
jgi:hypothetical protein